MSSPIRAILFDLGDTVVQYGDVDRDALFHQAALRTYQMWADQQKRMPDFRRYYLHQWFAIRWGYFKLLLLRRDTDAMRLIRRASRKLWLNGSDEFFRELTWNWYRPLAEQATLEDGTAETLAALRDAGYRLGLVSNTFVPGFVLDRHLSELGLIEYFPHRVYSCDVGYRKPSPRIFEAALAQVGVSPHETVFIGDLPRADVAGSRRAGMWPIWKRSFRAKQMRTPRGAMAIDRLVELPELIEHIGESPMPAAALTA